jgi:hypothetical protein
MKSFKYTLYLFLLIIVMSCEKKPAPAVVDFKPAFGPEKTLIVVKGMDFEEVTSIKFDDGVDADFNPSFGTDSALLFRVPFNAKLGPNMITITTETGETSFPFRVTLEAPEVEEFYPKSANQGDQITITGKNFFEPLEVLFFDSIAGKIIFHSPDSVVVEVPANVKKGKIKLKANGGSSFTGEQFFSTKEILVNDFDGKGVRSETNKWDFYGFIDQLNSAAAVQKSNPNPVSGNFLKLTGKDIGSQWIGGTENHSNDVNVFKTFDINSDINNTFIEMDLNSNSSTKTHLIVVMAERDGSPNDFTYTTQIEWSGWKKIRIPLNRFKDVSGVTINPKKIKAVKLHLYNELKTAAKLEANIDNLKFILIN